jgi:hypothetical protein
MQSTEAQLSSNAYILEVAQHNRSRTECFGCELQNIDEKYYVKSDLKCLTMIIYRK